MTLEADCRQPTLVDRALQSVHLLSLGIWAGVLLMVGVTAAVTFPRMAELDVRIPAYEQYDGEHHRIAAGQVMNTAFTVSDWIGMACMLLAAGTLIWIARQRVRARSGIGPAFVLRCAALFCVVVLTLFQTFAFRPSLNNSFRDLWTAAEAGENARAEEIRTRIAPQHAKASFLLTSQFVLVLLAGVAGGLDAPYRASREGSRGTTS